MPAPSDAQTSHALDGAIVLLDVDGTLVDSAPAITFCLARAIEAVGMEPPPVEVLGADIGPPLEDALASHGVPAEAMATARATYRRCYSEVGLDRSELYPEVADTLDLLCSAGARLATATSKRVAMATDVCAHLGILEYFEVIGGAGDLERLHKPEILAWTLEQLGGTLEGETAAWPMGCRRLESPGATAPRPS